MFNWYVCFWLYAAGGQPMYYIPVPDQAKCEEIRAIVSVDLPKLAFYAIPVRCVPWGIDEWPTYRTHYDGPER